MLQFHMLFGSLFMPSLSSLDRSANGWLVFEERERGEGTIITVSYSPFTISLAHLSQLTTSSRVFSVALTPVSTTHINAAHTNIMGSKCALSLIQPHVSSSHSSQFPHGMRSTNCQRRNTLILKGIQMAHLPCTILVSQDSRTHVR